MSTIDRERSRVVAPLVAGERLDRATFQERYAAMPPGTWAELIGGVVVMPSPVGREHGNHEINLGTWANCYRVGLPGLYAGTNTTTLLDDQGVPQPDVQLHIDPTHGGQTRIEQGYVAGAPEFVAEVARSSRKTDLGPKLEDYRRAGVIEYLVVTLDPDEVHWFVRRGDRLVPHPPDTDGTYRSEVFPGLWLDPKALFADDLQTLLAVLDRGKATPEHAAFAARLAARGPKA
jgi:Putative restriction endonuclease